MFAAHLLAFLDVGAAVDLDDVAHTVLVERHAFLFLLVRLCACLSVLLCFVSVRCVSVLLKARNSLTHLLFSFFFFFMNRRFFVCLCVFANADCHSCGFPAVVDRRMGLRWAGAGRCHHAAALALFALLCSTAAAIDIAGPNACSCQDTKCSTFACRC